MEKKDIFTAYQINRIRRLWGPFVFSTFVYIGFRYIRECFTKGFTPQIYFLLRCWPALIGINSINDVSGYGVCWYVSAMFWAEVLLSALLIWQEAVSTTVVLPVSIFLSYTYMYSVWGNNNLGNQPVIGGFLSVGLIRAVCVLAIGIESYYFCDFIKGKYAIVKTRFSKFSIAIVEILCVLTLIYCMTRKGMESTCFLIYPAFASLLIIFGMNAQVIHRVLEAAPITKMTAGFTKYTYMIYLCHAVMLENLTFYYRERILAINPVAVYVFLLFISVAFGIIMFHLEKIIERMGSKVLQKIFVKNE